MELENLIKLCPRQGLDFGMKKSVETTRICLDKQLQVIFVLGGKEKLCSDKEAFGCKPKNPTDVSEMTMPSARSFYTKS